MMTSTVLSQRYFAITGLLILGLSNSTFASEVWVDRDSCESVFIGEWSDQPRSASSAIAHHMKRVLQRKFPNRLNPDFNSVATAWERTATLLPDLQTSSGKETPPGPVIDERWGEVEIPKAIVQVSSGPNGAAGISVKGDRIYVSELGGSFERVAKIAERLDGQWIIEIQGVPSQPIPNLNKGSFKSVAYRNGVVFAVIEGHLNGQVQLFALDLKLRTLSDLGTFQSGLDPFVQMRVSEAYVAMAFKTHVDFFDLGSSHMLGEMRLFWNFPNRDSYEVKGVALRGEYGAVLYSAGGKNQVAFVDVMKRRRLSAWTVWNRSDPVPPEAGSIDFISDYRVIFNQFTSNGSEFAELETGGWYAHRKYPADITRWSISPDSKALYRARRDPE